MALDCEVKRADLDSIPADFSVLYHPEENISLKSKQQGFKYFSEGYFSNVQVFSVDENTISVRAKCFRSMRKTEKPHQVNFDIRGKEINLAYCSCQAGMSGSCSHVIGLITAVNQWQLMGFTSIPEEISCTSLPQSWNAPRGARIDAEPVSTLRFVNPKLERKRASVQNKITDLRKIRVTDKDLSVLQALDGCGIGYLVSHQPKTVHTHLGNVPIGSGLASQAQFYVDEESEPATTGCGDLRYPKLHAIDLEDPIGTALTLDGCHQLEEQTRDQADSSLWFEERKKRLTSSQFGLILKRKKVTDKFVKLLMEPKPFTAQATTYGRANEKKALSTYSIKTGHHVHKCGLIVNPKFHFLGATPDGKVCVGGGVSGLVEVKCPYSARDMTILEACDLKDFCLQRDSTGHISLKRTHNYFYQIQGQLLVSGAKFCELVVFTRKDMFTQQIPIDTAFCKHMLESLATFYKSYCAN